MGTELQRKKEICAGELLSHHLKVDFSYALMLRGAGSAALAQLADVILPVPVGTLFRRVSCYLPPVHSFLPCSAFAARVLCLLLFSPSVVFSALFPLSLLTMLLFGDVQCRSTGLSQIRV